jgi:hypothetical protein
LTVPSNNGGSLTSHVRIAHALRAREALELRLAGFNYAQIGERMGFSRQHAHQLVTEELGRVNGERNAAAAHLRSVEAERLDRLQAAVWPRAVAGELRAVDRVLSIMARRARLLGLDAQPDTLSRVQAMELVQALLEAVRSEVTDPETLRRIRANIGRSVGGGTLLDRSSDPQSEIDREIDSDREGRTCETLVDPG